MGRDAAAARAATDAEVHAYGGLNTIVAVNAADVIRTAVFFDAVVIINRGAVDSLALDLRRVDGRIGRSGKCSPRHRHGPA